MYSNNNKSIGSAMKKKRFAFTILGVMILTLLSGCDFLLDDSSQSQGSQNNTESQVVETKVKVLKSESSFVGTQYAEVVEEMEGWGFINVEATPIYDIVWGITKPGSTKTVTIDGSRNFKKNDVFENNVPVVVTYSMPVGDDPANKKYTITWKNDDGTVLKTDSLTFGSMPSYSGKEPTKPAAQDIKYVFNGWTPEVEAVKEDKTYTAKYLETANIFTITFDLDGGQWDLANNQSVIYNGVITASTPTKAGFNFNGWVIKGIFSNTPFDPTTKITQDYKLTATWNEIKHTVTFDLDGGSWSLANEQNVSDKGVITTTKPTKEGHEFAGWLLDGVAFDVATQITGPLTLKAQWNFPNYESILVGKWESTSASAVRLKLTYLEFDGIFYDKNEMRTSVATNIDNIHSEFTLYGNRITFTYEDLGVLHFTLSYSTNKITLKSPNYSDIVLNKTEKVPNTLDWRWNGLYSFAQTKSTLKSDIYGSYYEINMDLTIREINPLGKLVESSEIVLKVYQNKGIIIEQYFVGVNDPSITMLVKMIFNYSLISNNNLTDASITIESEGYTLFSNDNDTLIVYHQQSDSFLFETTVHTGMKSFPITNAEAISETRLLSQGLLYDTANWLIQNGDVYMFTE